MKGIASTDELPDLSTEYPLSDAQIDDFRADGHITLRGVCAPDEVAAYREAIIRATFNNNKERRELGERDAFGKAFLQTMNLRFHDEGVRRFVLARRFGRIAADLMGVEATRIYHEQSLFKEPGAGVNPTPWHQDQYYWPFAEPTTLGMWMPLVDVKEEMGAMMYASGTHKRGFLGQHAISEESQRVYGQLIEDEGVQVVKTAPMKAGDACFHYGWTLHSAGANASDTLREAMIVTFFADGMRVMTPTNPYQEKDRLKCLGGVQPGEPARSDVNPIVFAREDTAVA